MGLQRDGRYAACSGFPDQWRAAGHPAERPEFAGDYGNCIRCHTQLNTEFVKTGKIDYMKTKVGEGKACWDCHRDVPHGGQSNLAMTPNALVPYPDAPAPDWLKKMLK